jgi:hypothetical protein
VTESVFADIKAKSFPYTYHGTILVARLVGGAPSDPNVARGWLETKLKGKTTEEQIQRMVAELMVDRKMTADEALDEVNRRKNLNGFKRGVEKDNLGLSAEPGFDGVLYYEGRQLKAALKEAVSVAVAAGKIKQQGWGQTRKWISGFFPEHVFIPEKELYLQDRSGTYITEPTDVLQQFVHTRFGSSVQYQEYVDDAQFDFTVVTDHYFSDRDWGMIWTTGEMNGLGASRSQSYGTYQVIKWEKDFTKEGNAQAKKLDEEQDEQNIDPTIQTIRIQTKKKAA